MVTETQVHAYPLASSPLELGHLSLRNRIVQPSHTLLYGEDRILSDRHIAYYKERALGGVGLIIAEGGSVHLSWLFTIESGVGV
jgi:2,4-dienoyl-CoA reductase-like NADH-dependent reductase (Old Yellow Enzyme family)